jgi:hypothetical protein
MTITVRSVQTADLPALAEMESQVWNKIGAHTLSLTVFESWLEEKSPLFLVAEEAGIPCGFYFGRMITLSVTTALQFLDSEKIGMTGINPYPHDPNGQSVYGVTMLSTIPGAGKALYACVWQLKRSLNIRYSIGISRLPGLRDYVEKSGIKIARVADFALWYALSSSRLLKLRTWPLCQSIQQVPLGLTLTAPNRMLAFHTYGTSFGLLGVLPNYMKDYASMDCGAVILSEYPHR